MSKTKQSGKGKKILTPPIDRDSTDDDNDQNDRETKNKAKKIRKTTTPVVRQTRATTKKLKSNPSTNDAEPPKKKGDVVKTKKKIHVIQPSSRWFRT